MKYLIIFIALAQVLNAQSVNMQLLDRVETRVAYLKERLELSDIEAHKLVSILYKSRLDIANIDLFADNPNVIYADLMDKRNASVKQVIGDKKYRVYSLFEQIEKEDLLNEYAALFDLGIPSSELNEKLIEYRLRYIFPVLSTAKMQFVRSLSIEDLVDLRLMQTQYYAYANRADLVVNQSFSEYLSSVERKIMSRLLELFRNRRIDGLIDLDKMRIKWQEDQDRIAYDHIAEVNISEEQKKSLSKGQFILKQDLFHMHIMMLVPGDQSAYLQNLQTILNLQKKILTQEKY